MQPYDSPEPTDTAIPRADLLQVIRDLIDEAYHGPGEHGSWFASPAPNAGVLGTVADLTAERASRSSRPGGPSIASHVEHLRWSLAAVNATLRGAPWQPDWRQSWSVSEVDEAAWTKLRNELRDEFSTLQESLRADHLSAPMLLRGILALAPHAAYHLGAIRLLVAQLP